VGRRPIDVVPRLLKAALAVGLAVGLVVELGRPAAVRLELQDVAKDAANLAEEELPHRGRRATREEARQVVESSGARLVDFDIRHGGRVSVRVARHVDPVVLDDLSRVKAWYEVEIDATSNGVPGA
jgi:hypothetical protein